MARRAIEAEGRLVSAGCGKVDPVLVRGLWRSVADRRAQLFALVN